MKKIAVFTSIRSEYGPLTPLLKKLNNHPDFELRLMVGGAHLLNEYGKTVDKIIEDGFLIHTKFPFLFNDLEADALFRSLGVLQQQVGKYFVDYPPDLLIVLGDRFELIPVVLSALMCNIPIAHISGGEYTEGAIDNQIRHAVTKMAHIHFPATDIYAENLIQMGEEKWRIFKTGEPALDLLESISLIPKEELFKSLGLKQDKPLILSTFHPETISNKITSKLVKNILLPLLERNAYQILITASNFDDGGAELNNLYSQLSQEHEDIVFIPNLGQLRYYSILKNAALMLGNSSSGLIEAQSFFLPVVNVGERQAGKREVRTISEWTCITIWRGNI